MKDIISYMRHENLLQVRDIIFNRDRKVMTGCRFRRRILKGFLKETSFSATETNIGIQTYCDLRYHETTARLVLIICNLL